MGRPFPVALLESCEAEGASLCFFPPGLLSRTLGFPQSSFTSRSGRLERDHPALPAREKGNKIKIYYRKPSLWRGFFRLRATFVAVEAAAPTLRKNLPGVLREVICDRASSWFDSSFPAGPRENYLSAAMQNVGLGGANTKGWRPGQRWKF
jgi:hypothetical protein